MFAFFLHSTTVQDMNIVRRFIQNEECKEQMKMMLKQLDKYSQAKEAKAFISKCIQTDTPSETIFFLHDTPYMTVGTQTDFPIYDDDYIDVNND
jgi:hypothetical protein